MFKKILSIFKSKPVKSESKSPKSSKNRNTIGSTRIGELGEYKINIQLDQLPKDCQSISDVMIRNSKSRSGYSQIDHIVISPYGIFVIETKNRSGEIKGEIDDTYWTVNSRYKMYNPLKQNYGHIKALESLFKEWPDVTFVSMISFTMRCRFSIDPGLRKIESNELVVYDTELSEFISRKIIRLRALHKVPVLQHSDITVLIERLRQANIADAALRAEHVKQINGNKSL